MKTSIALLALSLLCLAPSGHADQPADVAAMARQAIMVVEREDGPILALIAPEDADPVLKTALRSAGKVVARGAVPKSKAATLPKGYLLVEKVRQDSDGGWITVVAGPGALKGTLGADVDCGKRYVIRMRHDGAKWENGPYQTQQCHVTE